MEQFQNNGPEITHRKLTFQYENILVSFNHQPTLYNHMPWVIYIHHDGIVEIVVTLLLHRNHKTCLEIYKCHLCRLNMQITPVKRGQSRKTFWG